MMTESILTTSDRSTAVEDEKKHVEDDLHMEQEPQEVETLATDTAKGIKQEDGDEDETNETAVAATKDEDDEEKKEDEEDTEDAAAPPPPKLRTVNDYEDEDDLRRALWTRMDGTFVNPRRGRRSLQDFDETKIEEENSDDDDDFSEMEDAFLEEEAERNREAELDPEFEWVITNLDAETSVEQSLEEELRRLQVLKSYLLLDSKPEPSFDHLTALASRIFDVPIALVSLVDLGRAWFMSNRGLGDVKQIPRRAFCAHAILSTQDMLIVPNTHEDIRFKDALVVANPPHIGFYAGCPLVSPEGVKLGTFCLLDTKPRKDIMSSNLNDKANLRELAQLTMDLIVKRRREQLFQENDKTKMIACVAHDLLTPLSGVQMSLCLLKDDCADDMDPELKMSPEEQLDLIDTAHNCTEMMSRICHDTIETCRADMKSKKEAFAMTNKANNSSQANSDDKGTKTATKASAVATTAAVRPVRRLKDGHSIIALKDLIKHITLVMEPYPKKVPLYVTLDPALPGEFVSNDLKVFRSIINYLTNACKHTQVGCIHLRILLKDDSKESNDKTKNTKGNKKSKKTKQRIVFEVEDTGKGVPEEHYPMLFRPFRDVLGDDVAAEDERVNSAGGHNYNKCLAGGCDYFEEESPGLGLYSVATNIGTLGGTYGFRPRETLQNMTVATDDNELSCPLTSGSIFWFSLPFVEPPPLVIPTPVMKKSTPVERCHYSTSSSATTSLVRNHGPPRDNHQQHDGVSTAGSSSIVQSITDSYKARPVRGNVRVCDTVPRNAYCYVDREQEQQPIKESEQYYQKTQPQKEKTQPKENSIKQPSSNIDLLHHHLEDDASNKKTSCKKKILIKAKRLCGGRLNSSQSSIVSLRNGKRNKVNLTSSEGTNKKKRSSISKSSTSIVKKKNNKKQHLPPLNEDSPTSTRSASTTTTNSHTESSNANSLSLHNICDDENYKKHEIKNDADDDSSIDTNPALIESNNLSSGDSKSQFADDEDDNDKKSKVVAMKKKNSSKNNGVGGCASNNCGSSSFLMDMLNRSQHAVGGSTINNIKNKLLGLSSARIDVPPVEEDVVPQSLHKTKNDRASTNGHVDRLLVVKDEDDTNKFVNVAAPAPCVTKKGDTRVSDTITNTAPAPASTTCTSNEKVITMEPTKVQRKPKALVIDDSVVIRKTLNRALMTLGFDVTLATNGMEGLQKLQQTQFDVTFCDFLMPVMDGLDCVQQFRSWEADRNGSSVDGGGCYRQYIIGISAHANQRDVQRGIEVGMDHFMGKPVPLKALKDLIKSEKMIQIRQTLDEMMERAARAQLQQEEDRRRFRLKDGEMGESSHGSNSSIWNREGSSNSINGGCTTSFHVSSYGGSVEFIEQPDCVDDDNFNDHVHERRFVDQETPVLGFGSQGQNNVSSGLSGSAHNENKPTCLVAEDSATIARVLKRAIEGQGWNVDLASDGATALQKLQQRNYDVVLMDDTMPNMSGTECMELFRDWEQHNRVSTQKHVVWMSGTYVPPPPEAHGTLSLCPPSYPTHLYDAAMSKPVLLKDLYKILTQATSNSKSNENSSSDIMVR